MLTDKEKRVIADKMGWRWSNFYSSYIYVNAKRCFVHFDLNDAGLVRDWLVGRGEWNEFLWNLPNSGWAELTAWLFATDNGEATNFFKAFVDWCKKELCK